ncbi:Ca-activated chloride channel family protein [Fodinibius salinus]|uniref:Ca-activated chloride channel family protein n=1 Tax=Fodinibius salinus TaxID=860790 RepID=A0A5D3YLI0_9BACT|nr:VWA domain-containing protein [Fodinibius salinus]TYP95035.1 Ca-activated chloride channel family protein [Fodinibius salinus]
MSWANPQWLWLLLLLIPIIGYHVWKIGWKNTPSLLFSDTSELQKLSKSWRSYGIWAAPILQWIAFGLVVLALARPQYENTTVERNAEGIDIVLTLDISTSMKAQDLKPNRLEAAKDVAKSFINKRVSDRIGLVLFARKSFTMVPPTLDYDLLKKLLGDVEMGTVEDGTAIGMGIATAVNRLKKSEAKSKVIILLTDGQNNSGEIDPVTAADLALSYDIKVYTIGAGTRGTAPYPVNDPVFGRRTRNIEVNIDEEMLKQIANMTGGAYFRATDTESLKEIYNKIDQLEKSEIDEIIYTDYTDLYPRFLLPAILLFILALVSDQFLFRKAIE